MLTEDKAINKITKEVNIMRPTVYILKRDTF